MKEKETKLYAMTVVIKPKPVGNMRFKSKTYRGIVVAENIAKANELTIQTIVKGAQSVKECTITEDVVFIKECKLHNDFCTKQVF
jgi:hypothetical protein